MMGHREGQKRHGFCEEEEFCFRYEIRKDMG